MPVTDKESLLAELDQLLDQGEPLLAMFPIVLFPGESLRRFELPENISSNMRWYADHVAFRELNGEWCENPRQRDSSFLRYQIRIFESGLLGWRALGVIR